MANQRWDGTTYHVQIQGTWYDVGSDLLDLSNTYQAKSDKLTALSDLTWAADKLVQLTGTTTAQTLDLKVETPTPTFTFATAGDLSVTYHARSCAGIRIGGMAAFVLTMEFTPTHTTASGTARFEPGFSFTLADPLSGSLEFRSTGGATVPSFPSSVTQAFVVRVSGGNLALVGHGSATDGNFTPTHLTTGVRRNALVYGISAVS